LTRRRKLEATTLLNEAKKLDKRNMLKEQIVMMRRTNEESAHIQQISYKPLTIVGGFF
jgi:hypothetical protein